MLGRNCVLDAVEGVTPDKRCINICKIWNARHPIQQSACEKFHALFASPSSLYNAKIVYQWNIRLPNGSSMIRTKVDPTSAIDVTWTDTSATDGGRWVTDFRLPLEGTTLQALASDVRVRRQFNF